MVTSGKAYITSIKKDVDIRNSRKRKKEPRKPFKKLNKSELTRHWITEHLGHELTICRYKKPGKRGIMPVDKVMYYNRIDIGILLYILETCLGNKGIKYQRELFDDTSDSKVEKALFAKYKM